MNVQWLCGTCYYHPERNHIPVSAFCGDTRAPLLLNLRGVRDCGMEISGGFSPEQLLVELPGDSKVTVVETYTQKKYIVLLAQWIEYWKNGTIPPGIAYRALNIRYEILDFEFSDSVYGAKFKPPMLVVDSDLLKVAVEKELSDNRGDPIDWKMMHKWFICAKSGCFKPWQIEAAGSSMYWTVQQGRQIVWLVRPTLYNVNMFVKADRGELQFTGNWLADICEAGTVSCTTVSEGEVM